MIKLKNVINKHKSNKIKENSNTVRHLNNGTDHRRSKSCCDQSSPARRTISAWVQEFRENIRKHPWISDVYPSFNQLRTFLAYNYFGITPTRAIRQVWSYCKSGEEYSNAAFQGTMMETFKP